MLNAIDKKRVVQIALFHIAVIALANYTVQFTGTFMGYYFTWAMFVFPLVILATDLTVRLSSQSNARVIVGIAYIPAILISAWLADWRIGLASGTAYLVGQLLDITVFQRVRERTKLWWPAPLLSTFFANIIDTYTFFSVAFYQSADEFMAANWVGVASVDLGFKIVVSMVLFLPVYGVLLNFLGRKTILHTS
ncbi:queuosine precursor transporter [Candidatus Spongiihabitans sp.]|uniref:queuosine precursor transporter n=1 Tax=Candidatus Spongiihabitans sp. TaxID=3101308 RepID=UPI003C701FB0